MSTHNIGFYEDLTKIIIELSSNTHLISSADVHKHTLPAAFEGFTLVLSPEFLDRCTYISSNMNLKHYTHQPLYNTDCYNTILDKTIHGHFSI